MQPPLQLLTQVPSTANTPLLHRKQTNQTTVGHSPQSPQEHASQPSEEQMPRRKDPNHEAQAQIYSTRRPKKARPRAGGERAKSSKRWRSWDSCPGVRAPK